MINKERDMAWGGAGIGAAIGAVFGGPIGAGVGAAVGHWVSDDSDSDENFDTLCPHCREEIEINHSNNIWNCPHCDQSFFALENIEEKDFALYMYLCTFGVLAKIAKIDGVISQKEAEYIKGFMDELCDTQEEREEAKEMFDSAKNDENSIDYYGELLYSLYSDNKEFREIMYRAVFEVAAADGGLEEVEKDALQSLLVTLDIEEDMFIYLYDEILQNNVSLEDYYKVLECSVDTSDAEIKRAYMKKVAEYHPDTLMSKKLPESFIKFANEQMQLINEAYEAIKSSRK